MAEVFVLFELLLQWVLGDVAERWGLQLALVCLMAQPLGVLTLVFITRGVKPRGAHSSDQPMVTG